MDVTISILGISLTFEKCFIVLVLCLVYVGIVEPILFRYWVIPNIECRYNSRISASQSEWVSNYTYWRWGAEAKEISFYIVCKLLKKYFNYEPWLIIRPTKGTYLNELKRINYDIEDAKAEEIILSLLHYIVNAIALVSYFMLFVFITKLKAGQKIQH